MTSRFSVFPIFCWPVTRSDAFFDVDSPRVGPRMSENRKIGKSENFQKVYSGGIPRINFSDFPIFRFFLNSSFGMDSQNQLFNRTEGLRPPNSRGVTVDCTVCVVLQAAARTGAAVRPLRVLHMPSVCVSCPMIAVCSVIP
jgi:hypothetical protein